MVILVYAVMSVITFVAYALDKRAAIRRRSRTPETRLHLLEALGGWPGALLAQRVVRHKRRERRYLFVFWLIVLIHVVAWWWWLAGRG